MLRGRCPFCEMEYTEPVSFDNTDGRPVPALHGPEDCRDALKASLAAVTNERDQYARDVCAADRAVVRLQAVFDAAHLWREAPSDEHGALLVDAVDAALAKSAAPSEEV